MSAPETADQRHPVACVVHRVGAWAASTEWVSQPQPALASLLDDARETVWTTSRFGVCRRVVWIHVVARFGRIPPWLVLRYGLSSGRPVFGELPAVQTVLLDSWSSSDTRRRTFAVAYWVASFTSRCADYAPRTGLYLLAWFFALNALNATPLFGWAIPDGVNPARWIPAVHASADLVLQIVGAVALATVAATAIYWRVTDKKSPTTEGGSND